MTKNQEEFKSLMSLLYGFVPELKPGKFLYDFFNYVVDKKNPSIPVLQWDDSTLNRYLDNNALSSTDAKTLININNTKIKEYLENNINKDRLSEFGSAIGVGKKKTVDDIANKFAADLSNVLRNIASQKKVSKKKILLETSVNKADFNKTFELRNQHTITPGKNQKVSIYTLEFSPAAFQFNQEDLFQLIKDNLVNYVNSKVKNNKLDGVIGVETLQKVLRRMSIGDKAKQLSEMLLYVFLEASLNAPKIMSKIQLEETGSTSYLDGIHIHRLPIINSEPQFDIVFGSSCAINNIKSAIDNTFEKVIRISRNSEKEINLLSEECLDYVLPEGVDIKSILLPHPEDSTERPLRGPNVFGIFVGYTFNLDTSKPNLLKEFQKQYERDFKVAIDYINQKIIDLKLNNYSFYIYLLPLNDIDDTTSELYTKLMFGE